MDDEDGISLLDKERDALHILPLCMLPFKTTALRRARLIKNTNLKSVVELFAAEGSGSGQLDVREVSKQFDWPDGHSNPDMVLLRKLEPLPSFDVYSLRILLRQHGIAVDSQESLKLSEAKTRELSEYMTEFTHPLIKQVYGGGDIGLMSMVARATLEAGGKATGIIPHFIMEFEVGDPGLTELIVVDSMHARKRAMFERSDGFVALPGGLGTLDETFEIITWRQLKLHDKPIVIWDVAGYWKPLAGLMEATIEGGFSAPENRNLFTLADSLEDVFSALETAPESRPDTDATRL